MREPRILARLRDELGGEDDTYLDAVVAESLRLRPVIDANERTLTKRRTIAGWELPAGIRVYLARRPRTRTARPRTCGHARHHLGPSPWHAGQDPKSPP